MTRFPYALGLLVALAGCGQSEAAGVAPRDAGFEAEPDTGPDTAACGAAANGIEVAAVDLDGFPSYALSGCTLVYVAPSGDLVQRDLASGSELRVASAAERPRRPTLSGAILAWEADRNGKSVVRVRTSSATVEVAGAFDHAGEPRATTDGVIFTGWLAPDADGDTDVFFHTPGEPSARLVAGGSGQQRFADASETHFAVSDFSEDPGGRYLGDGASLADVLIVERATGQRTLRQLPGKQAFPMLGSRGTIIYLDWLAVHPVPKFQDYTIRAIPVTNLAAPGRELAHVESLESVRATTLAGRVEWITRQQVDSHLLRVPVDGSEVPREVALPKRAVLHAPILTPNGTVLAVQRELTSPPVLETVPQ